MRSALLCAAILAGCSQAWGEPRQGEPMWDGSHMSYYVDTPPACLSQADRDLLTKDAGDNVDLVDLMEQENAEMFEAQSYKVGTDHYRRVVQLELRLINEMPICAAPAPADSADDFQSDLDQSGAIVPHAKPKP